MLNPAHSPLNIKGVRWFGKAREATAVVGGKSLDEHEKLAASFGTPWDTRVAALVERLPIVMPDVEPWEEAYYELQQRRSDRQKEYPAPLWQREEDSQDDFEEDADSEQAAKNQEEDGIVWEPASRVTEADEKDDRTSLFRALPHSLFLIQRTSDTDLRIGGGEWRFVLGDMPSAASGEEEMESMSERAIRHVDEQVVHGETDEDGNSMLAKMESMSENGVQLFSVSNAPIGFLPVPYSEEHQKQKDAYGAKVFFYRSQLLSTDVTTAEFGGDDCLWVTKDELGDYFDEDCCKYLRQML